MAQTQTEGATAQAQEKAQEVAGQAKEQAQNAAGQAKQQLRSQVDQRSTQAGQQVSQQANDMRSMAEQLRQQGKDRPAQFAERAADRAERFGRYLEQSDGDRILGDVEDFARRRPWAIMAGGVALGFAASRFLKASQGDRYRSRMSGTGTGTSSPYATTPAVPPTASRPGATGNELSSGVGAAGDRRETSPRTPRPETTDPVTGGVR